MLDVDTLTALATPVNVAAAAALALLSYLMVPVASERAVRHLPTPASTLPLLHNTLDVAVHYRGRFYDFLRDECLKHKGKPWRLKIVGKPVLVVLSTPDDFEHVLKTKFDGFGKGALLSTLLSDFLGNGVFAVDGMLWLHQRKTASHLFSLQMMRDSMEQSVVHYTALLCKRFDAVMQRNEAVNIKRLLDAFTMDVFTKIGFGVDLQSIELDKNPPFLDAFERASANLLTRSLEALPLWQLKRWLRVGCEGEFAKDIQTVDDMVYDVITQSMNGKRVASDGKDEEPVKDLITLFLEKEQTEYANGESVATDPKFIRDMALNFVAAGRDTTSQTMSWFIIMLNRNPHVVTQIRNELRAKLPKLMAYDGSDSSCRVPSMEDVAHLDYLEAAIRESLRLNPVLAFTTRVALRDTTLHDGTFIKEGTRIALPHYALGRMPWVWGDDVNEYKPERWLNTATGKLQQVSPFKFSAFNAGPRICLGMKFAFMEMKITMAALLSKFDVTTERDPHAIHYRQTATMSIDGPLMVRLTSWSFEHAQQPAQSLCLPADRYATTSAAMTPTALRNLVLLVSSTALWAVLFHVACALSWRYVRVYRDFSHAEQGDWSSRINSTIHAVIIVVGMLTTLLKQNWDDHLLPMSSTSVATALFSFSCGYFVFDLYVLVRWRVPLWRVFVIHHIVAAVPYLIYNFYTGCGMDFYLLSLFLLVEFAVIPMNVTTFLEQLGYGKTPVHKAFFYITYVCWFAARVVLPLYNVYVLWERIIPQAWSAPFCVLPAAVCGHLIAAFCVGVFVFVWTPDVLAKWRAPVVALDEYSDYELTLRQSITPRASPLPPTPAAGSRNIGSTKRVINYGTMEQP